MFVAYTMEQHDDHYYNDDAQKDCADCVEDARIDQIAEDDDRAYGDHPTDEDDRYAAMSDVIEDMRREH